ncbi:hypothetical protein SNL152K_10575 [Streptomyces sp. NL15-2K]|nr:hypothetical protein SNL152K_10575 [Streptomyces sp. NL15-2K]
MFLRFHGRGRVAQGGLLKWMGEAREHATAGHARGRTDRRGTAECAGVPRSVRRTEPGSRPHHRRTPGSPGAPCLCARRSGKVRRQAGGGR